MRRIRVKVGGIFAVVALVAAALAPSYVSAGEYVCGAPGAPGSLGAVVSPQENLSVPPFSTCTLTGTIVPGTIKVEEGATLIASGVIVYGSIQADKSAAVTVSAGSRIGGSVQVKESDFASVTGSVVIGDVQVEKTLVAHVSGSSISGSVQLKENGDPLGRNANAVMVTGNDVGGDLQLTSNVGLIDASSNTVGGSIQATGATRVHGFEGGTTLRANVMQGNLQVFGNAGDSDVTDNRAPAGALQCKENELAFTGGGNTATIKEDQCLTF